MRAFTLFCSSLSIVVFLLVVLPRVVVATAERQGGGASPSSSHLSTCELAHYVESVELEQSKRIQQMVAGQSTVPFGCVSRRIGFWTYEYCQGRWLRQFHEERGVVVQEYFLGIQRHWREEDEAGSYLIQYAGGKLATIPSQIREMTRGRSEPQSHYMCTSSSKDVVVAMYESGTHCDLTGRPRRSTVILACATENGAQTFRINVQETAPCEYKVTVASWLVCDTMGKVLHQNDDDKALDPAVANKERLLKEEQWIGKERAQAKRNTAMEDAEKVHEIFGDFSMMFSL